MERYINADILRKNEIARCHCVPCVGSNDNNYKDLDEVLNDCPTADVAPRSEVAREIFEDLWEMFIPEKSTDGLTYYFDMAELIELKNKYVEPVHCKDCQHLMFSDCYGECSKGHRGIVNPDDTCKHGIRKTEGAKCN